MDLIYKLAVSEFKSSRADFYEDIAERVAEGASFYDEIKELRDYAKQKRRMGSARLYGNILRRLEEGKGVSDSLRGLVPESDLMALSAAETSGSLDRGLQFVAKAVRASNEIAGTIKKSMMYPAAIFLMLVGVLVMFSFFLMPVYITVVPVSYWPGWGQQVYALSTFFRGYWWLVLGAVAGGMWALFWSFANWSRSPIRDHLDRMGASPWGLYRTFQASIFLISLAAMMEAGVSLSAALDRLQQRATPWMRMQIGRIAKRLSLAPSEPASSFDTGLFGESTMQRIYSFGRRASFQDAVSKLALQDVDKTLKITQRQSALLNSVFLLLAAAIIVYVMGGAFYTSLEMERGIKAMAQGR